jgi:DHA1 family inner membrane transport protein
MLGALAAASFLLSTSGLALSPFLQTIADELHTGLAAVANLLSFTAVAWGAGSLIAGAASDRFGRRPILVGAVLAMGGSMFGFATSASYPLAIGWMIAAGLCGGSYTGTVYAAVSDHVPSQQRGRALGWVITGQSLSMVFGVPLLALLGAFGGWRGAIMTYAVITAGMALTVRLAMPADPPRTPPPADPANVPTTAFKALARPDVLTLLGAGTTERTCFAIVAVYTATYLQTSYGVSLSQVAFGLAMVALGTVSGNMLGGYIADRVSARTLVYGCSALATALLALPLLLWQPGLGITIALGSLYTFSNSLGRPSLLASLSEVPAEVRGAVLGMNVTMASVGWLAAAALGGWLITHYGFHALALLCSLAGLLGCVLGLTHWRMTRFVTRY